MQTGRKIALTGLAIMVVAGITRVGEIGTLGFLVLIAGCFMCDPNKPG